MYLFTAPPSQLHDGYAADQKNIARFVQSIILFMLYRLSQQSKTAANYYDIHVINYIF